MKKKIMSFENFFFDFQIHDSIRYQLKNKCESFYFPGDVIHVCVNGKSQQ